MTRREKARIVACRVADRIREVSPEGLGRWDSAWDYIGTPSDTFMDALKEWENADSPSTRSQLEVASADLIGAWAQAARRWEAVGCPSLDGFNTNRHGSVARSRGRVHHRGGGMSALVRDPNEAIR